MALASCCATALTSCAAPAERVAASGPMSASGGDPTVVSVKVTPEPPPTTCREGPDVATTTLPPQPQVPSSTARAEPTTNPPPGATTAVLGGAGGLPSGNATGPASLPKSEYVEPSSTIGSPDLDPNADRPWCGASLEQAFGLPIGSTVEVGRYTVSPFQPEARAAQYATEPGLHRAYNVTDGPAGSGAFARLLADSARSSTPIEPLSEVMAQTGGTRLTGLTSGDAVTYERPSGPGPGGAPAKPTGVVVVDFPGEARITLTSFGHPADQIIEFLKAVDLRVLLQF